MKITKNYNKSIPYTDKIFNGLEDDELDKLAELTTHKGFEVLKKLLDVKEREEIQKLMYTPEEVIAKYGEKGVDLLMARSRGRIDATNEIASIPEKAFNLLQRKING